MMETWFTSSLTLVAIPILGALLGLVLWRWPHVFKVWTLMFLGATGLGLTAYSGPSSGEPTSSILMGLIVMTALLTVLAHNHQQKDAPAVSFMTLILVGLGLGFLTSEGGARISYLAEIFVFVGLALFYFGMLSREMSWVNLGQYVLGLLCLAISVVISGPLATMFFLVALLVVFPLFPFNGGFVATLSNLPGSLPAFLVVLFPSIGFSGISSLIHDLPVWLIHTLLVLALLSALYSALKALVQFRMGHLLAYTYLVQIGIVWWYVAISGTTTPHVVMYFCAVTLVTSGLYLASHYLNTRFGHLDMDKMGGVALSMPRLTTTFVVLITAAMGLPLFAGFSAFFNMILHISTAFSWSVLVILLIWLMMSWHYPLLMHRIFFGRPLVPAFPHRDLGPGELCPLILTVLILVFAGLVPSDLVGVTHSPDLSFHVEEVGTWKP